MRNEIGEKMQNDFIPIEPLDGDDLISRLLKIKDDEQALHAEILNVCHQRVGSKVSEGMSAKQIDEFERIIDDDIEFIDKWLDDNYPDYEQHRIYRNLQKKEGLYGDKLVNETASILWIVNNRPDYRQIVKDVVEEIALEIDNSCLKGKVDVSVAIGIGVSAAIGIDAAKQKTASLPLAKQMASKTKTWAIFAIAAIALVSIVRLCKRK